MNSSIPIPQPDELEQEFPSKKAYTKPAVIHELELETRAGSPLGIDPLEDATGIFGTDS